MVFSPLPLETQTFQIQAYRQPRPLGELQRTHVAFSGSPRQHPFDEARMILIADPFSTQARYYEFLLEDIHYVEELPNLVTPEGDAVTVVRVWIKKGSIAVQSTPFVVEDTLGPYRRRSQRGPGQR